MVMVVDDSGMMINYWWLTNTIYYIHIYIYMYWFMEVSYKERYPPNHPSHGWPWLSIETHAPWDPAFKKKKLKCGIRGFVVCFLKLCDSDLEFGDVAGKSVRNPNSWWINRRWINMNQVLGVQNSSLLMAPLIFRGASHHPKVHPEHVLDNLCKL